MLMAETEAAAQTGKKLQHWPALDGIRGAAILLVALYHLRLDATGGMFYSVPLFFTLSGFLITTLLLAERQKSQTINLRRFYYRRAYRLLPALFTMCVAYLVVTFIASSGSKFEVTHALARVFIGTTYITNLVMSAGIELRDFAHLWTLAMEEQFYLVWPILLAFLLRKNVKVRTIAWATVGAFLASGLIRALLYTDPQHTAAAQYGPWSRGAEVIIGCTVALFIWEMRGPLSEAGSRWLKVAAHVAAVAIILHMALPLHGRQIALTQRYPYYLGFSVVSLSVAVLISAVRLAPGGWWQWILELPFMQWLGRISYGMYLWHLPIYRFMTAHTSLSGFWIRVVDLGLSMLAGELSYRFVEQVWLRRRDRRVRAATPIG